MLGVNLVFASAFECSNIVYLQIINVHSQKVIKNYHVLCFSSHKNELKICYNITKKDSFSKSGKWFEKN